MITRREFLRTAGIGAGAVVLNHRRVFGQPPSPAYFALHDFVEQHPDAVFIFKTSVGAKTDATAIKNAGRLLGNSLFVAKRLAGPGLSDSRPGRDQAESDRLDLE